MNCRSCGTPVGTQQQFCPNCGAALTGSKCDYCNSKIKDIEFKISSIKKIVD